MCDTLTRFVKESKNWREAGESMPLQMCQEAVQLSFRILKHLSSWRCRIHELLAWRKSAPTLYESLQFHEDVDGYNRIPSRVIRIFHDSDVPLVLETLVCVDGLAKLFKKTKDCIMPSVKNWLNHVVQLFIEQASTKKRGVTEVDTHKVFQTIENLKLQILEGRHSLAEISSSDFQSFADVPFDAQHPDSLLKLRRAAEELFFLCGHQHNKHKISSYICGHPGAVAPGVHKATQDLLHQLYMMQEVLKSDEHLEKIMDFSDMSLREREIEVTGTVHLNRASAAALQLAHGAIKSSYGGSLEPVFTALELLDGASEKLLTVYKSQLIFLELRQTAMEGLEVVLDEICKQAVVQAKVHACVVALDVPPSHWVDEINGVPSRASNKFDCVFQKKSLSLAGYDVDIETAIVDRLEALLKSDDRKIFAGLDATKDPTLIAACHMRMEILKAAHEWLTRQVPLARWKSCAAEKTESCMGRLSAVVRESILQKLFREFSFDPRSRKFKPFHENNAEPFSFKISARPSTPKIRFDVRHGLRDNASFGFHDTCVIHKMMSATELEQLIADVQSFVVEELRQFMDCRLLVLFDFIPLELIDLRISELSLKEELTAIECLSFVLEKFGTDIAETSTWMDPLRALERIGNGLVFLHFMHLCLVQHHVSTTIQQSTSLREVSNVFMESVGRGISLQDIDSGNPFEMEILKKKVSSQEKAPVQKPPPSQILQDCVQMMSSVVAESEKRQMQRRLNIKNAISAVLFLKTYAQTNARLINVSYGDGVLWAANLITQLSGEGHNFELVDWIHEIIRLAQIDDALHSIQTQNDIRSFLSHAQRITATWKQISQFRLYDQNKKKDQITDGTGNGERSQSLKMVEDTPLRGFFGGVSYAPNVSKRVTHNLSGCMGPLRASMIKNKTYNVVPQASRSTVGSTSMDPFHHISTGSRSIAMQDAMRGSMSTWKPLLEEAVSSSYLHHRHSN